MERVRLALKFMELVIVTQGPNLCTSGFQKVFTYIQSRIPRYSRYLWTATGNKDVITLEHMELMKDQAMSVISDTR